MVTKRGEEIEREVLVKQWIAVRVPGILIRRQRENGTGRGRGPGTPVSPSNNYQFHADVERRTGGTGRERGRDEERERERALVPRCPPHVFLPPALIITTERPTNEQGYH